MDVQTKKYVMIVYYTGLVAGTVIMNYMIKEYKDMALSLMEQFQGLDKLQYVKEKELFLYLLYKRAKQLVICSYLYFYVGKKLVLYAVDFYFSFVMGVTMALFVHYDGWMGMIHTIVIFLPIVIFYGCIYYMAWLQALHYTYGGRNTGKKKAAFVALFGGIGVIAEMAVNYLLI